VNRKTLLSVLLLFLACTASVCAKEIKVGFGQDSPPFIIGQTGQGLEIDIFKAALANKGYTINVVHMPKKRLENAFHSTPTLDAIANATAPPLINDGFYYVAGFVHFEDYAFTKARNHLTIDKISDLKGLDIIAWGNAHRGLGAEFEALFKPEPKEEYKKHYSEKDQKIQNLMFWTNRVQVIICDKTIFAWYRKQLQNEIDTRDEVKIHPIFPKQTYYAAFKDKKLADEFAAGLAEIKKSGLYDSLYRKYTE